MALDISGWSTTPLSNSTIDGINIAENCPYANMNDMGRAIMSSVRAEFMDAAATVTAATLTTISGLSQFKPMSGSTTIDGFATAVTGMLRDIRVLGTPLIKNSSALALQGAADRTMAAGDMMHLRSLGAGNWIAEINRKDGLPIITPTVVIPDASVTAQSLAIKGNFQPYAKATPDMQITLAEGTLQNSTVATRIVSQNTATLTAPSVNPRKDIVYVDALAGTIGVATGAENASPVDPAVPAGKIAIARLRLATSTTSIPNSLIDDIRPLPGQLVKSSGQAITVSSTDVFAHGLGAAPDDFGAYFVMGASTELGYTSGDRIPVAFINDGGAGSRGASIKADATNITATWGSAAAFLMNASTGSYAVMDYTKWTLVLWARA